MRLDSRQRETRPGKYPKIIIPLQAIFSLYKGRSVIYCYAGKEVSMERAAATGRRRMETFQLRMPPDMLVRLRVFAKRERRTIQDVIRMAVEDRLKAEKG